MEFIKLSDLVGDSFTIQKVNPFVWKLWDATNRKMLVSDSYEQGYRKIYPVYTDKGKLDLGAGQMGNVLEAAFYDGKADLNGATVQVKSNGKSGMDIRYYFNVVKQAPQLGEKIGVAESIAHEEDPFAGMELM